MAISCQRLDHPKGGLRISEALLLVVAGRVLCRESGGRIHPLKLRGDFQIAILMLFILFYRGIDCAAQERTAPTENLSPAEIDLAWQHASAKFDQARSDILKAVDQTAEKGPFRPDWESLGTYQIPKWYQDAKFGIFIHWGVYSVPAFGSEWYPRRMYLPGSPENQHQVATYGPLTKFGYKDFIPMFRAERYDPQAWADLFRSAGAKYVVLVFEHHDGFAMYDSGLSDWTAAKMGPRRDVAADLARAVRADGLHFGASSHRIEHDWFLDVGRSVESDVNDPQFAEFYGPAHQHLWHHRAPLSNDWTYVSDRFASDWLARDAEIVEKYQPEIMYFDYWIGQPSVRPFLARFAAYYYNYTSSRGTIGVINYKETDMEDHSAVLDVERGQLSEIQPQTWQTDTSIGNKSWGYIQDETFKTPAFIVHELVDIVSKNGNLLLNVGPRADGVIPDEVQNTLLEVGAWLKINGEAIYGTRACKSFAEGPTKTVAGPLHDVDTEGFTAADFRFTCKDNTLYAIEMAEPPKGETVIRSFISGLQDQRDVRSITLIGSEGQLNFKSESDGLHIEVPEQLPGKFAYVFRIELGDRKQAP